MRPGLVFVALLGLTACDTLPSAPATGRDDVAGSVTASVSASAARLFVDPRGSDAAPCTRQRPCAGLQRAYTLARPGEVVEVAAGRYPEQVVGPRRRGRGAARRVVVRPAPGARVRIQRLVLESGVADIEFRGLAFPEGWIAGESDDGAPAENVVFRRTSGSRFSIENARGVRVLGGSYGPSVDDTSQIKVANPGAAAEPTDILVEGVRFRDYTRSTDDIHTECLQIYAGRRVTIRRNRFTNCDGTGALALTTLDSTRLRDVLVENNWFGDRGDALFAVQIDESVERLVFRYNSALEPVIFTECTKSRCGSARVLANALPFNPGMCSDVAAYAHNVLLGGTCSAADVSVRSLGFVDPAGFDLHLRASSPAICRGDPGEAPAVDIDGRPRSATRRADAGADQVTTRVARSRGCPRR